jgi:UDP-N-acetylmuramoyl-tripeptide--D-alanyl-D-alanine ligase
MAEAMHGEVVAGAATVEPSGFAIDSRIIASGQAFFAIVAERNGHAFAADAVRAGASVVVIGEDLDLASLAPATVVRVADTTRGLQDLARAVRRRAGTRVVAITGSAGKTTTKEAAASFLDVVGRVIRNQGNLNNHLGLPLSLLELRHGADLAVMELGMNHAGEIHTLVGIAEPDVRVWTNVGDAHIGHFGTPEAIAAAKAEIMDGADAGSLLVANADDPRVMAHAARFGGRVVTFGLREGATVRATAVVDLGLEGMQATVECAQGTAVLRIPLLGRGNLSNVLAAAAVAVTLGVPLPAIAERARLLRPARRRGEVHVLRRGVTVVDDSYNSSPTALMRALETLALERHAHRRVAVLGEMLELGDRSVPLHEACGRTAAAAGLGLLITVGGAPARALGTAAVSAGLELDAVRHLDTSAAAALVLNDLVQPGDVVLIKGSRGTRTDVIVDRLLEVGG